MYQLIGLSNNEVVQTLKWGHVTQVCIGSQCVVSSVLVRSDVSYV